MNGMESSDCGRSSEKSTSEDTEVDYRSENRGDSQHTRRTTRNENHDDEDHRLDEYDGYGYGIVDRSEFSLDMISMDMDFEQAYSMYANLQHKPTVDSMESMSGTPGMHAHGQMGTTSEQVAGGSNGGFGLGSDVLSYLEGDRYGLNRSQSLGGRAGRGDAGAGVGGISGSNGSNKNYSYVAFPEATLSPVDKHQEPETTTGDFDRFLSSNESNALERFLDNLTSSNNTNPLQLYNTYNHSSIHGTPDLGGMTAMYDLHTMKPSESRNQHINDDNSGRSGRLDGSGRSSSQGNIGSTSHLNNGEEHERLKRELSDAFSHPPMKSMKNMMNIPTQVPTPADSRHSSSYVPLGGMHIDNRDNTIDSMSDKRSMDEFSDESTPGSPKRRKRSTHKPLLSLEQKRLNHSYSEQKRRQLCKLAYERCLRLIIDVEKYKSAPDTNKKSKRARVNKIGLPNLSKHTALMKISNEITKIKSKNDAIKKLISDTN